MTSKPTAGKDLPATIFSHPIRVADVPPEGLDIVIEADAATLRALAAADGLPNVAHLTAEFHVVPKGNGSFNVSGEVKARVTQVCVISLEPFECDLVETVDVDFAPPAAAAAAASSKSLLLADTAAQLAQERDPPDPIVEGKIDLGALASEFLALGLDPYPRKLGASFEPAAGKGQAEGGGPFDVLRKLKKHP